MQPLSGKAQFENVFASADAKQHSEDVFLLLKENNLDHHRVGLISAKKKLRRAVDRNRFRRVARAQVKDIPTAICYDVIAMAKGCPADLHQPAFSQRFHRTLAKALKKSCSVSSP